MVNIQNIYVKIFKFSKQIDGIVLAICFADDYSVNKISIF